LGFERFRGPQPLGGGRFWWIAGFGPATAADLLRRRGKPGFGCTVGFGFSPLARRAALGHRTEGVRLCEHAGSLPAAAGSPERL